MNPGPDGAYFSIDDTLISFGASGSGGNDSEGVASGWAHSGTGSSSPTESTIQVAPPLPRCQHTIGPEVRKADGRDDYATVLPGDTVCVEAGVRESLRLENFYGEPGRPITFVNSGGVVTVVGDNDAAIRISNSQHVRLTGTGVSEQCGSAFAADDQQCGIRMMGGGRGVAVRKKTAYLEVDHVEVSDGSVSGITVSSKLPRDKWTLYDIHLHHNYIHDFGREGVYVGSSQYSRGRMPVLKGVEISYNLVTRTGWDGIQVGSAVEDCAIHDNKVTHDSQSFEPDQRSGIMNNRGSVCDIYKNLITDGAASGIYVQGNGGNTIHNNIIMRSGQMELTGASGGSGIIVVTGSNVGQSVHVWNNLIFEPEGHGVRFTNEGGTENTIRDNIIVSPGGTEISISRRATVAVSGNQYCDSFDASGRCEPAGPS